MHLTMDGTSKSKETNHIHNGVCVICVRKREYKARGEIMIRLRFTISGGLEGLAKQELEDAFGKDCFSIPSSSSSSSSSSSLSSIPSGQSGSSLEVTTSTTAERILPALEKLRFVDYVSMIISTQVLQRVSQTKTVELSTATTRAEGTREDDNDNDDDEDDDVDLPACITSAIEQIDIRQLDLARRLGRGCQIQFYNRSVGLESLPGKGLSLPINDHGTNDDDFATQTTTTATITDKTTAANHRQSFPFQVNTIYTRHHVAKAIVHLFVQSAMEDLKINHPLWLDAGAGSGALFNELPHPRLGVDTDPQCPEIECHDFLSLSVDWISEKQHQQKIQQETNEMSTIQHTEEEEEDDYDDSKYTLCVISNPPFADGSRGDYSSIVAFANQAVRLGAMTVGLIVPTSFARCRIWHSLGLSSKLRLHGRCPLPNHSFWNPATQSSVHIQACFLLFHVHSPEDSELMSTTSSSSPTRTMTTNNDKMTMTNVPMMNMTQVEKKLHDSIYISARRDKSDFPNISSSDIAKAVAMGLERRRQEQQQQNVLVASQAMAEFHVTARLFRVKEDDISQNNNDNNDKKQKKGNKRRDKKRDKNKFRQQHQQQQKIASRRLLELSLLLNPERPLSLVHSMSRHFTSKSLAHSLGGLALSAKPSVAAAMYRFAMNHENDNGRNNKGISSGGLTIVPFSGEGTFELEAQHESFVQRQQHQFVIGGDCRFETALATLNRLKQQQQQQEQQQFGRDKKKIARPVLVDMVVWDAQRLPLRRGIADLIMADLPMMGSTRIQHQSPRMGGCASTSTDGNGHDNKRENNAGDTTAAAATTTITVKPPPTKNNSNRLNYRAVMVQLVRTLSRNGRTALVSADTKALGHAIRQNFHLQSITSLKMMTKTTTAAASQDDHDDTDHPVNKKQKKQESHHQRRRQEEQQERISKFQQQRRQRQEQSNVIPIPRHVNLGGLNAQLHILQKKVPCTKDISIWIDRSSLLQQQEQQALAQKAQHTIDLSIRLSQVIEEVLVKREKLYLDPTTLEVKQHHERKKETSNDDEKNDNDDPIEKHEPLITNLSLIDIYDHPKTGMTSHCYRITFHDDLTNQQANDIERMIRIYLERNPLNGTLGLR